MTVDVHTRFMAKVSPEPNTGCWLWTGAQANKGYGVFVLNGTHMSASRASFILHNGPIAGVVMHRCDNPPCVNPDHLKLGTYSGNNFDMTAKDRWASGARQHVRIVVKGVSRTLQQWAAIVGCDPMRIKKRLGFGWSPEDAVLRDADHRLTGRPRRNVEAA